MDPSADAKIKPLQRVSLDITAGTLPDATDIIPQPHRMSFIYGIGTGGLSPFEFELADKARGDCIQLSLHRAEIDKVFEHLARHVCQIAELRDNDRFVIDCRVVAVESVSSGEIVKAMAEGAECGGSCSCCGGHA